jgi:hypothetical protein
MSHANGQVKFNDGLVLHYEYNGTCDVVCPALWRTNKEVWAHWRDQPDRDCTCGHDEPVEIATDYGSGCYWTGRACRRCMVITDGFGTGFDETIYDREKTGITDWWE